jgi:hypothetical protein
VFSIAFEFCSKGCPDLIKSLYLRFVGVKFRIIYTSPIMTTMGWTQYWGAFAPNVISWNYHSTAVIEFADGTSRLYEFPHAKADRSDLLTDFCLTKERQLFNYTLPKPGYSQFLPSVARFIAKANVDPINPPTMVTILVHTIPISPPDPKHWIYRDQLPYHTRPLVLFIYKVTAEDLVQAK